MPELPVGNCSVFQVTAPSVDEMAVAPAEGSCKPETFGPTATQEVSEEQATESRDCEPPFTVPSCHVAPESLEVRIPAPTATQSAEVGQSTEPTPRDP